MAFSLADSHVALRTMVDSQGDSGRANEDSTFPLRLKQKPATSTAHDKAILTEATSEIPKGGLFVSGERLDDKHGISQAREDAEPSETESAETPDEIRESMLADIVANLEQTSLDEKKYKELLKNCFEDYGSRYFTIFHWILDQVDGLDEDRDEDRKRIRAAEKMMDIAMTYQPPTFHRKPLLYRLLPLHTAIASKSPAVRNLTRTLCQECTKSETVRRAISMEGSDDGTNCLHLAISQGDLDLAKLLISMTDKKICLQQRTDDVLKVKGRTALHYIVEYTMNRCVFEQPACADSNEPCEGCVEEIDRVKERVYLTAEVFEELINKCPEALAVRDFASWTPLLCHLRTEYYFGKKVRQTIQPGLFGTRLRRDEFSTRDEPRGAAAPGSNSAYACGKSRNEEAARYMKMYMMEMAFLLGGFKDACRCLLGDITGKLIPLSQRSSSPTPNSLLFFFRFN